jgi:hypothetical protein
LPTERGIAVSYEIVRRWVKHFGPMITAHLRKRRPKPHAIWHLNEVYLQIDGRMVYLWRAVDAGGLPSLPLTAMNCALGKSGATCSIAATKRPEWPMGRDCASAARA